MGMIYGNHGRVIGKAENKPSVHQTGFINRRLGREGQTDLAVTVFQFQGGSAKILADASVGLDIHGYLREGFKTKSARHDRMQRIWSAHIFLMPAPHQTVVFTNMGRPIPGRFPFVIKFIDGIKPHHPGGPYRQTTWKAMF
jgi:hypothetical protein